MGLGVRRGGRVLRQSGYAWGRAPGTRGPGPLTATWLVRRASRLALAGIACVAVRGVVAFIPRVGRSHTLGSHDRRVSGSRISARVPRRVRRVCRWRHAPCGAGGAVARRSPASPNAIKELGRKRARASSTRGTAPTRGVQSCSVRSYASGKPVSISAADVSSGVHTPLRAPRGRGPRDGRRHDGSRPNHGRRRSRDSRVCREGAPSPVRRRGSGSGATATSSCD